MHDWNMGQEDSPEGTTNECGGDSLGCGVFQVPHAPIQVFNIQRLYLFLVGAYNAWSDRFFPI